MVEKRTLKISRLVPPEWWVARVGGSLQLVHLAAFESNFRCLVAIILNDRKAL